MNFCERARRWLIKRLGGYPNEIEAHKIVFDYKSIPIITVKGKIEIPHELAKTDSFTRYHIATQEIADRIGRYIVDNDLYITQTDYDPVHHCEIIGYMVKLADIQKEKGIETKR